ncbi:MAG: hypothetical protein EOP86_18465 [Verrucomicrobiaceae bacterium]|nr:MAG: hypothetical protein EOP86_18465 [Verrucomicrobiaceae bacterium]
MELARTAALVEYAGEPWFPKSAASDPGAYMGQLDPEGGTVVMERFQDAGAKKYFMDPFLRHWLAKDAGSVGKWLNRHRATCRRDPGRRRSGCRAAAI